MMSLYGWSALILIVIIVVTVLAIRQSGS